MRHVASAASMVMSHALVTESMIDHLLSVITSEVVQMLSLQFVLDALTIWRVPDQRKNRSDAFHEKCSLRWLSVIQSSLKSI